MLIKAILLMVLMIVCHELGHWLTVKWYKGKTTIKFKNLDLSLKLPNTLTEQQKGVVLLNGVFLGLLPFAYALDVLPLTYGFVMILLYLIGCRHDLTKIFDIMIEKRI